MIPGDRLMRSMDIPRRGSPSGGPMGLGRPAEQSSQKPPSLRQMREPGLSCGTCGNFTGEACAKFGDYPVKPDQVCDAFEPQGEEASGEAAMEEM